MAKNLRPNRGSPWLETHDQGMGLHSQGRSWAYMARGGCGSLAFEAGPSYPPTRPGRGGIFFHFFFNLKSAIVFSIHLMRGYNSQGMSKLSLVGHMG